jgi:sec-independent protein translocase protein TatC
VPTMIQRSASGARSIGQKSVNFARDPMAPYRAIREVYGPDTDEPEVFDEMTLQEHLIEVRDRIVRVLGVLLPLFLLAFIISPQVLQQIQIKANALEGLDVRSPTDPLSLYFKVAFYIAIALGMPAIVYQVVAFLSPGLTRKEKRMLFTAMPFISLLFLGGVSYAYFVAAPNALNFLSTFQAGVFHWQPDGQETLAFFLTLMLGLGIAFQLPLVMFILAKLGILLPYQMRKWRKYAILAIAIAAAVITPSTDPFNMILVAIPLYILYELGIIVSAAFAATPLIQRNTLDVEQGAA